MRFDFTGKTVLITGATRGLGKQFADDFSSLGADLLLTGTDKKTTDALNKAALQQGLKRKYFCVDFTDRKKVDGFLKVIGKTRKIDVCVNNAGINHIDLLEETKEKDWDDIVKVNLKGPYLLTRAVAGMMKKSRYGRIINIGSIFGTVSRPKRSIYSVTKSGIHGFTVAVSNELAPYGILVNTVSPGFVLTDLTRKNLSEKERRQLAGQIPVGRLAVPEDISRMVVFLSSDLNTYLTGKNIIIDGGFIDA